MKTCRNGKHSLNVIPACSIGGVLTDPAWHSLDTREPKVLSNSVDPWSKTVVFYSYPAQYTDRNWVQHLLTDFVWVLDARDSMRGWQLSTTISCDTSSDGPI